MVILWLVLLGVGNGGAVVNWLELLVVLLPLLVHVVVAVDLAINISLHC